MSSAEFFKTLSKDDQLIFRRACTQAQIGGKLGLEEYHGSDDDVDRFELLKGSLIAGNNAPDVLKELKYYILKFMADGRLNRTDGSQLLADIAILA